MQRQNCQLKGPPHTGCWIETTNPYQASNNTAAVSKDQDRLVYSSHELSWLKVTALAFLLRRLPTSEFPISNQFNSIQFNSSLDKQNHNKNHSWRKCQWQGGGLPYTVLMQVQAVASHNLTSLSSPTDANRELCKSKATARITSPCPAGSVSSCTWTGSSFLHNSQSIGLPLSQLNTTITDLHEPTTCSCL
jgi:hypothetical protein